MKKRILSLLLCLVMCLSFAPTAAFAEETEALALLPEVMSEAEPTYTTTADDVANYEPNFRFDESTFILSWDPCPGQSTYHYYINNHHRSTTELRIDIRDLIINKEPFLLEVDPITNEIFIPSYLSLYFFMNIKYLEENPITGVVENKEKNYPYAVELSKDYPVEGYSRGKNIYGVVLTATADSVMLTWDSVDSRKTESISGKATYRVDISAKIGGHWYAYNFKTHGMQSGVDYAYTNYDTFLDITEFRSALNALDNVSQSDIGEISIRVHGIADDLLESQSEITLAGKHLFSSDYVSVPVNWSRDPSTPFVCSINTENSGMRIFPDNSEYYFAVFPADAADLGDGLSFRDLASLEAASIYWEKLTLENGVIRNTTFDLTKELVVSQGSGVYVAEIVRWHKNPDTNKWSAQHMQTSNRYENRRIYREDDYFCFTSTTPADDSSISVKTGDSVDVSYTAYVADWMKSHNINAVATPIIVTNNSTGAQTTYNFGGSIFALSRSKSIPFNAVGTYTVSYYVNLCDGTTHYLSMPSLTRSFTVKVSTKTPLATPAPVLDPDGRAYWGAISGATGYEVVLKDQSMNILTTTTVSGTSCDLSSYMTEGKTYYCLVTALDSTNAHAESAEGRSEWTTYYPGEFFGIWIGNKPVTSVNRYDVLHDGGSVQFLSNGEAYNEDLHGNTLVLNNLNLTNPAYHTNADGHRAMLTIANDIAVVLIGENIIHPPKNGNLYWEDDLGSLDGVYIGQNMSVSFYGSGSLDVSVSRNNSALFSDNSTVLLNDNVTMRLSGKYGFNSEYSGIEVPWLYIRDNAKLYAYGVRDDNDREGLAIYCPEIKLNDSAYLYAEYEWNQQAVYTWDSDYQESLSTSLTIRGIRNLPGIVNTEWETLNSINTGTEDDEGKFRALEIRAGKPSVLLGDVNGDGALSILDVTALLLEISKPGSPSAERLAICDVNGDGALSILDVSAILLML